MQDLSTMHPRDFRAMVSRGEYDSLTCGQCQGYVQANLVILRKEYAEDFEKFARRNSKAIPLLEVTKPGDHFARLMADEADILTSVPRFYVYKNGELVDEVTDATPYWTDDMVCFLIGCSHSFEKALTDEGMSIRNIDDGHAVSVYRTSIPCAPSKYFSGPVVVSMRPFPEDQVDKVYEITGRMPHVHGAPIYHGDPALIGVDLDKPDWNPPTRFEPGEVPVFWGCGVTPQAALDQAKPDIVITHKPTHLFITDIPNSEIEKILSAQEHT
ncbi:MAG: putative hydro-lyase [Oscillospiraceae bacterium]|nr:putative hydro-lyase [Oscillospiraceae bacterium]